MNNDNTVHFILKDNFQEYRNYFIQNYEISTYPKDYIFNMVGMPVKGLYFLLEGVINVYTINQDGYTRFIGTHEKNTIFNLDSFNSSSYAIITTKAITPVQVIHLSISDIVDFSTKEPNFYSDFLIYTGYVLRLMCYDAQEQSINDVKTRLIHFFLLYTENNQNLSIPLGQYEIASAINASRIQVTRVCSKLKKENIIEIKRNHLKIIDIDKLRSYL